MRRVAAVWLLWVGCRNHEPGPVDPEPALFGGGDRLEPRVESFEGEEVLLVFHDTLLDLDCTFEAIPGPDGRVRCVPDAPAAAVGFFADDGCSTPVVPEAAPGDLVRDAPTNTCTTEVRWYEAAGPADGVFAPNAASGVCERLPDATGVRLEPLEDDPFVSADLGVEPRGPVDAWVASADDGAWQVVSGYTTFGGEGSPVGQFGYGIGSDGAVWWPQLFLSYVYGIVFVDEGCTEPAAQKFPADAACPIRFGITFDPAEPPLFHVGPEIDPADLWTRDESGACVDAGQEGSTDLFFALGEAVADEDLVPIVEERFGGGRIHRQLLGSASGEPVMAAPLPFWDDAMFSPCFGSTDLDGERRCIPPYVSKFAFSDRDCTELVAELSGASVGWGAASIAYESGVRVRRLAGEVETLWTESFASGTPECLRLPPADRPPGAIYRALGDDVPAELFVRSDTD